MMHITLRAVIATSLFSMLFARFTPCQGTPPSLQNLLDQAISDLRDAAKAAEERSKANPDDAKAKEAADLLAKASARAQEGKKKDKRGKNMFFIVKSNKRCAYAARIGDKKRKPGWKDELMVAFFEKGLRFLRDVLDQPVPDTPGGDGGGGSGTGGSNEPPDCVLTNPQKRAAERLAVLITLFHEMVHVDQDQAKLDKINEGRDPDDEVKKPEEVDAHKKEKTITDWIKGLQVEEPPEGSIYPIDPKVKKWLCNYWRDIACKEIKKLNGD